MNSKPHSDSQGQRPTLNFLWLIAPVLRKDTTYCKWTQTEKMVLEPAKRLRAFGVLILYDLHSNFFTSYIWAAITVFTISNMVAIPPVNKCHKIISGRWLQFTIALCKTEANNMRFAVATGLKKEHTCYSMNPVMTNSGKWPYLQNLQLHILACH